MKRFNVERELAKLERSRFVSSNKKSIMSILMPFFVIGFSCFALSVASYSLEEDNVVQEEVTGSNEIVTDIQKANTIGDDFGISEYYLNSEVKYVNLNNMMFRILRINGNGTYRIMLDYNIERDYNLSVDENIQNWFNSNFANNSYVVRNTFDNNVYNGDEEVVDLMNLNEARFDFVGLLSYREYELIYQYDDNSSFFLESYDTYNNRWCHSNGMLKSCTEAEDYGIRPVINIKVSNFSGEGTASNPFVIEE